jgi:rhodanese-related sulfurtransferase
LKSEKVGKTGLSILWLVAGVLMPASVLWAAEPQEKPLDRGKRIYTVQCAGCHGDSGEDTPRGEGTKTLPGIHIRRTDDEIGHRFLGLMAELFTEQERADLVAYVKSLKGKKGYEQPEYLINPVGLKPFVKDPGVRIIDLRSEKDYLNAHMPNAVHLDPARLQPIPDPADFAALMTDIGISDHSYVVAYDDASGRFAALLWVVLQDYGHNRVRMLDGGWQAWVREIGTRTHWKPSKRQVTFTPRPRTYTFMQASSMIDSKILVIDAGNRQADVSISPHIPWPRHLPAGRPS